ncbi:hypothetical protein PPNSA23_28080 [Phyllobacterium phragmitis]|uniref:Lytic murein transglycosylase n=1 Tax=Phyllobacterium phragmitis TaxID=2670329 RepID=A0ABQ0H1U2_9HYPH
METLGTPLCPAGHLLLKGGDWLTGPAAFVLRRPRLVPNFDEEVISPLEGEMPGRAEGGTVAPASPLLGETP